VQIEHAAGRLLGCGGVAGAGGRDGEVPVDPRRRGWGQGLGADQGRLGEPHRVVQLALLARQFGQADEDVRTEGTVTAGVGGRQPGQVEPLADA